MHNNIPGIDDSPKYPLVSVIMNGHNAERYLRESIDSVISQTYRNWEIIFWDNCSNDSTGRIVGSFLDKRINYYYSDCFVLLGEARNLAINKANGKYIAFLDCDDYWFPDKLKHQIDIFTKEDDNLAIVYGRAEVIYEEDKRRKELLYGDKPVLEGYIFNILLKQDFIPFVSVIIEKEKLLQIGGFPEHYNHSEDYWVLLHLSRHYRVRALGEVCCGYRIHRDNLTHSQHVRNSKEDIALISGFLPSKAAQSALRYHFVNLSYSYYKEGYFAKSIWIILSKGGVFIIVCKLLSKLSNMKNILLNR